MTPTIGAAHKVSRGGVWLSLRYDDGVCAARQLIGMARTTGRGGHRNEQQDGDHKRSQHNPSPLRNR